MAFSRKESREQFAVLGIGRFGTSIAEELMANGNDVIVIDLDPNKVNAISGKVTHAMIADITDQEALVNAGIANMDVVIIAVADNMQANILATLNCKDLGVSNVVCRASSQKHKEILEKLGADMVIVPEIDTAKKLAMKIMHPELDDIMRLTEGYSIIEMNVPQKWIGESLADLGIRKNYKVTIILVKQANNNLKTSPGGDYIFQEGDVIVVGSDSSNIEKFSEKLR